ncbi:MAG: hypothetical protein MUE96_08135 [Bacteroidia bacterium]|jgi:hypothetical protein|nr:hypothetical protein [Bacteroidia bacterium]
MNYDSLWYFHPFNIDILIGTWTPLNQLSNHYYTGLQFGAGFGIMTSKKTRIHLLLMPRILNPKNSISIKTKDSTLQYQDNHIGASFGGWFTYNFYKDKIQSSEVIIGLTREMIPTNILKENNKDSIDIVGLGLSIGINTWFNTFNKLNFGLRAVYTYSTYDNSKYLENKIGGHSLTFSLVYRFANRNKENKKWY